MLGAADYRHSVSSFYPVHRISFWVKLTLNTNCRHNIGLDAQNSAVFQCDF